MDIQQLKAFYEVARRRSFSKAAKELYLSQPAVSRQISSLETEIGLPLFIRTANQVSLTDSGRKLLVYAEEIIHTLEQATRTVQDLRDLRQGTVTVAADSFLSRYFLPRFAGEFHRRYPSLQLRILTHAQADLPELVADGQIDLAFFCGVEPSENLPLTMEPLYREQLYLITSAKPNLKSKSAPETGLKMQPNLETSAAFRQTSVNKAAGIPKKAAETADIPVKNAAEIAAVIADSSPFLFPPSVYAFTTQYQALLPPGLSSAEAPITVDSLEGIKTLLYSGAGCSILPHSLVKPDLEQHLLQGIPLDASFPIILTYPKDSRLPHPVLLLIGIIRKLIHQ